MLRNFELRNQLSQHVPFKKIMLKLASFQTDKPSWSCYCTSLGLSVVGVEKKADFIEARNQTIV